MPIVQGDIEIYLGPREQGGPDSLLEPIVKFIDDARSGQTLMIAVQEIDNADIAKAIVRARLRKVTIDVVIEQSYLLEEKAPLDAFLREGKYEINRDVFCAILRSTTDIKCDFNGSIFHQKFMVCGNKVLTGSTNFTDTGTTKNLNHIVVINNAKIANAYKKEFAEIRRGNFGKYSIDDDERPIEVKSSSGARIKPLFAPDHAPEMEIMKQILKARNRIDFAIFTFAESSGIDDALIAAKDRGVKIRGVFDAQSANQKWAASHGLKAAGNIDLFVAGKRDGLGKVHHKLMVIDDNLTIFGSFNYTGPANKLNDENIIIIGDLEETDANAKAAQSNIAMAARGEIDRIIVRFGRGF